MTTPSSFRNQFSANAIIVGIGTPALNALVLAITTVGALYEETALIRPKSHGPRMAHNGYLLKIMICYTKLQSIDN